MFRLLRDAVARLRARPRPVRPTPDDRDLALEVRTPDPYVWRLPTPYEARWRRWAKRSEAAGHYLPFPCGEACWQAPDHPRPPTPWACDDVVRPYVLRP